MGENAIELIDDIWDHVFGYYGMDRARLAAVRVTNNILLITIFNSCLRATLV